MPRLGDNSDFILSICVSVCVKCLLVCSQCADAGSGERLWEVAILNQKRLILIHSIFQLNETEKKILSLSV